MAKYQDQSADDRVQASIHVDIWDEVIPSVLSRELFRPLATHGAEVIFCGRVRNLNQGRTVLTLSYDAFAPLAIKMLGEIALEARSQWGRDLVITAIHRTGTLAIGDNAVVVAVSAPHRGEAYRASQYIIEELKHRAPIWKKEHYLDGESEWLQGHALCQHADFI